MINKKELELLGRRIRYEFQDFSLLENALTHSSYANEHGLPYTENNERLEFLGDAFFDAVIAEKLYTLLREKEEGDLSKI
ncbi:MAG: ribonuclease III family protein, partial [Firmicutes bacterium]|nr:ribonuclease III family protein [Bacillota bacterium]